MEPSYHRLVRRLVTSCLLLFVPSIAQDQPTSTRGKYPVVEAWIPAESELTGESIELKVTAQHELTVAPGVVTNDIYIYDRSGTGVGPQIYFIPRNFVKGEIRPFPQALVNGIRVLTQANVRTTHDDGSVNFAMISFRAPAIPARGRLQVRFTSQPRCFCEPSDSLSLREISDALASVSTSTSITNTLEQKTVTFNAQTMLTANGPISADFNSSGTRYWVTGPLVTQVIIEDRTPSRKFDVSFRHPDAGNIPAFHPFYVVTVFGKGKSVPVRVELIGENSYANRRMPIRYGLKSNVASYENASIVHEPNTRWRLESWSPGAGSTYSNQPVDVWVDFNLPYMILSGVVPNIGLSPRISDGGIAAAYYSFQDFTNCNQGPTINQMENNPGYKEWGDILGYSQACVAMTATGGRPDIGIYHGQQARLLSAMFMNTDNVHKLWRVLMKIAQASGRLSVFYREDVYDKRSFATGRPETAYGRFLSLDARPTVTTDDPTNAAVGDAIYRPTIDSATPWYHLPHLPSLAWLPYLLTGDYYFMESQQATAARILTTAALHPYRRRHPAATGVVHTTELRGIGWGLRELARAAWVSRDGSPEAEYFRRKFHMNIAVWEGRLGTPGAQHQVPCPYPTDKEKATSPYCYGYAEYPMKYKPERNPMRTIDMVYPTGLWQVAYIALSLREADRLGFRSAALADDVSRMHLKLMYGPTPQIVGAYYLKTYDDKGEPLQTAKAIVDANQDAINPEVLRWQRPEPLHGYPVLAKAVVAEWYGRKDGGLDGTAAWAMLDKFVPYTQAHADTPLWFFLPRNRSR